MVRSEERSINTPGENLTVQIYVGSSDVDLGTSDVNRKHCSQRSLELSTKKSKGNTNFSRLFHKMESLGQRLTG